jgi:hypothetical protein
VLPCSLGGRSDRVGGLGHKYKREVERLLARAIGVKRPAKGVQHNPTKKERWFVACGVGRLDKMTPADAIAFNNGAILAFVFGGSADEEIRHWSAGVRWSCGWSLHFHFAPDDERWPIHPAIHYQFTCPPAGSPLAPPPYADWRPPASVDAIEWIEWAFAHLV